MFNQQRMALNPGAVETNRAGKITRGQRFHLSARATGAVLGWVSLTVFAMIAWWFVLVAQTRWMAGPGLIATVAAPLALWALYRIVADLRGGKVVSETGRAIILQEGDSESPFRVQLAGRRLRLPTTLADLLHGPGNLTAFYTRWSHMLVNLTPAQDGGGQ
jgi:hypothetical protein